MSRKSILEAAWALLMLMTASASHAQYKAIISGNFSTPTVWQDNAIPPDTIKTSLEIPIGISVAMDKDLRFENNAVIKIAGGLNGNHNISIKDCNFSMTINGQVQVDSMYLDNSGGSFTINDYFVAGKLAVKSGQINTIGTGLSVRNLYIEQGSTTFNANINLSVGSRIVMRGGMLTLGAGKIFNANNNYDVTYTQAQATGIELNGTGLRHLTIDAGSGNNVQLSKHLTVQKGNLYLNSGNLDLNNFNLKLSGTAFIPATGAGMIKSNGTSVLEIDKPSDTNTVYLNFDGNGNTIHTMVLNAAGIVCTRSDMQLTNTLQMKAGKLNVQSNKLVLQPGATISNYNEQKYIVTGINGAVVADITQGSSLLFPIGTDSNYAPCTVAAQTGTNLTGFGAGVNTGVPNDGVYGRNIAADQPVVNATWFFTHNTTANVLLDIELMWDADMEVNNFNRQKAYATQINGILWEKGTPAPAATVNNKYSIKKENMTQISNMAVFDENTVDVSNSPTLQNMSIYPNPVSNVLNIQLPTTADAQATIYNSTGQQVKTLIILKGHAQADISTLQAGIYYLAVSADAQHNFRFVKL